MSFFYSNVPVADCDLLVRRHRCFNDLDQAFNRSVVCITAGEGYGKSVLLSSYLRESGLPVLWFTLDSQQDNYVQFLRAMQAGLSALTQEDTAGDEIRLLDVLSSRQERLVVVIDFAKVEETQTTLLDYLLQLVQHSTKSVVFVFMTRSRLRLPYAKLKLQNRIAELTVRELAFTPAEISEYMDLAGLQIEDTEAGIIHSRTGGWPLSLRYLADAWIGLPRKERKWRPSLFDELLQYVLSVDNDPVTFDIMPELHRISILHELKTEVLCAYFGDTDSNRLMDYLLHECFFLQRKEDYSYQFLPIIRDFLYRMQLQAKGRINVNELHIRAARIYEEQYQYFLSFAHYLAAAQYDEAVRLMQIMMNFYTPERFLHLLDGTLETICPSISTSTFSMFLFRCVPIPVLRSYVSQLEDAIDNLELGDPTTSLVYLQHRLGLILFYAGDVTRAAKLFERSLASSQSLENDELIIINLSLLAQCCRFMGELEQGTSYARRALTAIELHGAYNARMHTVWIFTELLLEQNQLTLAFPIINELLKLSEQYEDEAARIYAWLVKAKYERLCGNLAEAISWAEKALDVAKIFSIEPDLGWVSLELGLIHKSMSELKLASHYLAESARYFDNYSYFRQLVEGYQKSLTPYNESTKSPEKTKDERSLTNISYTRLSIQMFGTLRIVKGESELTVRRKSSLRLLLYLALHYGKKIPKDQLLEELFPDGDYESQNNRFYVSLSALRKALEPELRSGRMSSYIIQSGEQVYLNEDHCILDFAEFERLSACNSAPEEKIASLVQAENLYKGDLLEEYPYDSFIEPIRERTKQSYLQVLQELGFYHWNKKDYRQGMEYYQRILELDKYHEETYWEYLQFLISSGFIRKSQQLVNKMEMFLERDLGIPIRPRVMALYPDFY